MMRDPYHNARQRFKVARDRWIDEMVVEETRAARPFADDANNCEHQRHLQRICTLEYVTSSPYGIQPYWCSPIEGEAFEAARILHTMLSWKITDEQQAMLLWKLSRD